MVAVVALGCANPFAHFRPVPPPAAPVPVVAADDDDHAAWAEAEPAAIVVRKACRTLDLYEYGRRVASYPAVFGMNGDGRKLFEGDLRTPTGFYAIVDKRPHPRWREFMLLDYPNVQDIHRYRLAMETGDIPRRGGGYAGVGGAIGIHGTDKPGLNARGVDWTWGCISLRNDDILDLTRRVPVGTPVLIQE
jgi:murein L,D-transpeptidase YafK